MKKLVISFLFIAFASLGIAQNLLEKSLLEVYSAEQSNIILNDIQQKKYYSNLAFNSYRIKEISSTKIKNHNYNTLNSFELRNLDGAIITITPKQLIESIDNKTFNFLRLNIERDYHNTLFYKIGDTGYMLEILSYQTLTKLQKK